MTQQDAALSRRAVDQFCIDELSLNMVRIQSCVSSLSKGALAENDSQTPDIVARLLQLDADTNALIQHLRSETQHSVAFDSAAEPLVLSDPVSLPTKYSIERVLSKLMNDQAQGT